MTRLTWILMYVNAGLIAANLVMLIYNARNLRLIRSIHAVASMAARRARSRKCMTDYTPAELRAQVAAERAAAHSIIEQKNFSLIAGITCGMLMAAADQIERLTAQVSALRDEVVTDIGQQDESQWFCQVCGSRATTRALLVHEVNCCAGYNQCP